MGKLILETTTLTAMLVIEIPVHSEDGWASRSPEETTAKARLEASDKQVRKSAEELRLMEEKSMVLHQAHMDAIKAKGALESQRCSEAKARRLARETTARKRLLDRLDAGAQRGARLMEEKENIRSQRQERRTALEEAAKEARDARKIALERRATVEQGRCLDASSKRERLLQCIADKNAFLVKHALAKAASVKELEREQAMSTGERIATR